MNGRTDFSDDGTDSDRWAAVPGSDDYDDSKDNYTMFEEIQRVPTPHVSHRRVVA